MPTAAVLGIPPAVVIPTPGRGGAQHKYLQELIRRWAGANNWRVTIEKSILDGLGSVDVALERENTSVACEIGDTTSIEHEVEKLQKCVSAGFTHVISVVFDGKRAQRMNAAIAAAFGDAGIEASVVTLQPEALFVFLGELGGPSAVEERSTHGYKVRTTRRPAKPAEANVKARAIRQTIAGALRRLQAKP